MKTFINAIAVVGLACVIAFALDYLRGCNNPKEEIIKTSDTSDVQKTHTGTTVQGTKGEDSLIYITIYKTERDTVPVDTQAILRECMATRIYTNHYEDSLLKETIIDTLTGNKITGRSRAYAITYNERTITNTITKIKSPEGLYLGGETSLKDVGPGIMYLRKRMAYKADYQIRKKELEIGAYYKLFR